MEFEISTDKQTMVFNFLKENEAINSFLKLKEVAKVVLCILPAPANAERAFSRAHFLSENQKNPLSKSNLKRRLQCLNFDEVFVELCFSSNPLKDPLNFQADPLI